MDTLPKTLKNWWLLIIPGVLSIVLAIWIFMTPLTSYVSLAIVFSIFVFADGVGGLFFTISNWKNLDGRGWYLANAIMLFIIGIIMIGYPGLTLITLPFIVGFWLLMRGVFVISSAIEFRSYGYKSWGWILFSGIVLILFSVLIILNPIAGAAYVVAFTAVSVLMMGIAQILLAIQLKRVKGGTLSSIEAFRKSLRETMKPPLRTA